MREGRLDGRPCLLLALPDGLPELPEEEALPAEVPEDALKETPQDAARSDEAPQEEAVSSDVPPESASGADGEAGSDRQV